MVRRRANHAKTYGADGSNDFYSASGGIRSAGGTSKSRDRRGMTSNFEADETQMGYWTLGEGDNSSDTVPINGIRKDTTFEVEMSSLHSKKHSGKH